MAGQSDRVAPQLRWSTISAQYRQLAAELMSANVTLVA
jgi:hypothetical protein